LTQLQSLAEDALQFSILGKIETAVFGNRKSVLRHAIRKGAAE
jgi:hypothetical protein